MGSHNRINTDEAGKTIPDLPQIPTIGTATATGFSSATVAFTPSQIGGAAASYTVLSTPGSITATGTLSPIVITGLSMGTSYTFQVKANNTSGESAYSNASNQITTATAPAVSGGTLTSDATFYYRTFTANTTCTVTNGAVTADILVISGGGSGGYSSYQEFTDPAFNWANGGGGGAGGLTLFSNQTVGVGNTTVIVGAGGAGSFTNTSGSNSSFGALSTLGGGRGGANYQPLAVRNGDNGGSGGGGASSSGFFAGNLGAGGTGTAGQGNNGSNGFQNGNGAGGGGGGAAGAGGTPLTNAGGTGGAASTLYSTWASVTGTGVSGNYAGGGGGGARGSSSRAAGGGGGGGAGGFGSNTVADATGVAGTANTGGGGGGSSTRSNSSIDGSNGGSGIVIMRYTRSQVGG